MMKGNSDILKRAKKIHLIGIGGIGMSGIAEYLLNLGYKISGSDLNLSSITERLGNAGAEIFPSHKKENITDDIDLVIYSSAIKNDNEEFNEASLRGINLIRRANMLGMLVNDKKLISVSGTHGKTSTTAMIAKVLMDNNFDPMVFVGGNIDFLDGGSFRIGNGEFAVVEADEYDRSFLTLKSDIIVITNIELDHTDIYKDLNDIKNSFSEFCGNSKAGSQLVAFGDDENLRNVLSPFTNKQIKYYGFGKNNQYVIDNAGIAGNKNTFTINKEVKIQLSVFGNHNSLNASAAFIVCKELGISTGNIIQSLNDFSGVDRRLQLKYSNHIKVYDDYAHHPSEVRSSLSAIKQLENGRIITVFQPHLFTRTRDFYREFADALAGNDIVILAKIYPAREKEIDGVSSDLIFNEFIQKNNKEIYYIDDFDSIIQKLNEIINKGDNVVFQGAGDITELCNSFINQLKRKN